MIHVTLVDEHKQELEAFDVESFPYRQGEVIVVQNLTLNDEDPEDILQRSIIKKQSIYIIISITHELMVIENYGESLSQQCATIKVKRVDEWNMNTNPLKKPKSMRHMLYQNEEGRVGIVKHFNNKAFFVPLLDDTKDLIELDPNQKVHFGIYEGTITMGIPLD